MYRRLVPARFLLVSLSLSLSLACGAASNDPQAAANAAKSAGGALERLTAEPGKKVLPEDPRHQVPRGPGDVKPPPLEKSATCIVDDGDADTPTAPPQKIPPKAPKIPAPLDRDEPEAQGAVPKAASAGPSGTTQRSATAAPIDKTGVSVERLDYTKLCASKMTSEACETLCRESGLTWDSTAGNAGTCFAASTTTNDAGLQTVTTECGCMCK